MTMAGDAPTMWLVFRVGPVACAVSAIAVDHIGMPPAHVTGTPGATPADPGLIPNGHEIAAVVDMHRRFGLAAPAAGGGRLLITHLHGAAHGFRVDEVVGLVDAGQARSAPLPADLPRDTFSGVLLYRDELVLITDFARLRAMRPAPGLAAAWRRLRGDGETTADAGDGAAAPAGDANAPAERERGREAATPAGSSAPADARTTGSTGSGAAGPSAASGAVTQGRAPTVTATATRPPADPRRQAGDRVAVPGGRPGDGPRLRPGAGPDQKQDERGRPAAPAMRAAIRPAAATAAATGLHGTAVEEPRASGAETRSAGAAALERPSPTAVPEPASRVNGWWGVVALLLVAPLAYYGLQTVLPRHGPDRARPAAPPAVAEHRPPTPEPEPVPARDPEPAAVPAPPVATAAAESAAPPAPAAVEAQPDGLRIVIAREAMRPDVAVIDPPTVDRGDAAVAAAPVPIPAEPAQGGTVAEPESALRPTAPDGGPRAATDDRPTGSCTRRGAQCVVVHVVVRGDTLWDIAARYIDDPWRYPELAALSNVDNPHLIFPGQRIYIVFR